MSSRRRNREPGFARRGALLGIDALIGIVSFVERLLRGIEDSTPWDLRDFGPARMRAKLKRQLPLMLVVALSAVVAVVIAVF